MAESARIPCTCCGIMMLAETGAKTGGICMRCFGTEREVSRTKQAVLRAPTSRSRKFALALTKQDLETFPVWVRCSDDDDKVRPAAARALKVGGEFVVAARFEFADHSQHFGGVEVVRASAGQTIAAPFLRRKFHQNLARLERQIGRSLPKIFPLRYELLISPPATGAIAAPSFQLPTVAEDEV